MNQVQVAAVFLHTMLCLTITETLVAETIVLYSGGECSGLLDSTGKDQRPEVELKFKITSSYDRERPSLLFFSGKKISQEEIAGSREKHIMLEGTTLVFTNSKTGVHAIVNMEGAAHSLLADTFIGEERTLLGGTRHEYNESEERYKRINSTSFGGLDGEKIELEHFNVRFIIERDYK